MLSINPKLTGAETLRILKTTANPSGRWGCGAGLLDAALALDMTAGVPVEQDRWPRATWAGARSSAAATSADGFESSAASGPPRPALALAMSTLRRRR